jgi:hypothetical protein
MTTDSSNWTAKQWIDALRPKKGSKLRTGLEAALMPAAELSVLDVAVIKLAELLRRPNSPEGPYVWGRLSAGLRGRIATDQAESAENLSDSSVDGLVKELNGIIQGPPLWKEPAFLRTDASKATRKLCEGDKTAEANRALIGDAFPDCIAKAGPYLVPREFQQAEQRALRALNDEVKLKWKVLLLDPEFQKVLEEGDPSRVMRYCKAMRGLQPPGDFGIKVWCEMRSRIGGDNPLLELLSTREFLWRGRPRIDLKQAKAEARRRPKAGDKGGRPSAQEEGELAYLRHFVRRELRQGRIGALFLSYFENIQVTRSALMNEFGFSRDALKALSVIGKLIAADAEALLGGKPQVRLLKGKGPSEDKVCNDRAVQFFRCAWENPDFTSRRLVESVGRKWDSTNRKCAARMITLAASTRTHLLSS